MSIRSITSEDRETYLELVKEFYQSDAVLHPVPMRNAETTFDEALSSDRYAECFIVEHDARAVGFALVAKTFTQEAGGLVVWLEELYIRPQFRNLGLGRGAMAALLARYPQAMRFRLEVAPDNARVMALYRSMGFETLDYLQMVRDKT